MRSMLHLAFFKKRLARDMRVGSIGKGLDVF
jgi:hypothetical protein